MKNLFLFLGVIVSTFVFVLSVNVSITQALIYGVNEHQLTDADVTSIKDLGASMIRIGFPWEKVEKTKGTFTFGKADLFDEAVNKAKANNIEILGILSYTTPWASSDPSGTQDKMYPPKDYQDYFNYVGKVVERYPDVKYWEVWNEPNINTFWKPTPSATDYVRLLKGAYAVIKQKNPNAKVVLAGMAGTDTAFLKKIYDAGGKNYFDILAVHPYRDAPPNEVSPWSSKTLEVELNDLKNLMGNNGDSSKKIWLTEMGYSTMNGDNWKYIVSETKQAEYLKSFYNIIKKYTQIDAVFWFELRDPCVAGSCASWEQGGMGLLNFDYSPKKAFTTLKEIINPTDNAALPVCSEQNWTFTLSPVTCSGVTQQTKTWTKIGQCTGKDGVTHPASEIVMCNPAQNVSVKVMPLGDSITQGISGGYRTKLWNLITGQGERVDFVGSQFNGPASLTDKDHEGHPGEKISFIDSNINGWLNSYNPDIILLMIGTNDVLTRENLSGIPNKLSSLIDKITNARPNTKVFVSSIVPSTLVDANTNTEQNIINFNASIPGIVSAKASQGKKVYFVNMHDSLNASHISPDGVHPNQTGYDKMAEVWFDAIKGNVSGQNNSGVFVFTKNLTLGSDNEEVRQLQILLNSDPDTAIVASGPRGNGTTGKEVTYFGNATKEAVQKFQRKYGILPVNGFVRTLTREKLNLLLLGGTIVTPPNNTNTAVLPPEQRPNNTPIPPENTGVLPPEQLPNNGPVVPEVFSYIFTKNLTLGSENEDVRQLQIILNSDIETAVVAIGPKGNGTKGKEVTYFGVATESAVSKFQKKYGITPAGGFVGPTTRNVLNSFTKKDSFNITESNKIDLRVDGDGTGDGRTTIFDTSTGVKKNFTVSWLASGSLSGCKGLSNSAVSNWNGDKKTLTGTETIEVGNINATTTISLVCSSVTGEVTAQVKIDRTPAFLLRAGPPSGIVSVNFTINDSENYLGTSTMHFLKWNTSNAVSCIASSTPKINTWNNNSKYTSGIEFVQFPVGTTTISLKCNNTQGAMAEKTIKAEVNSSTYVAPPLVNNGEDKIKIKSPVAGANIERNEWTPINFVVKSGFSTATRINARLIGPIGGVQNDLYLGQFSTDLNGIPFNCAMAQADADRMMLCDATGLKFRALAGTALGRYQIKFNNAQANVNHIEESWIGPVFNLVKNDVVTGTPSITVISPNGGEQWTSGQSQTIRWTYSNLVGYVAVSLRYQDGGYCNLAKVPVSGVSYTFTPTIGQFCTINPSRQLISGSYRVALSASNNENINFEGDSGINDESNTTFSIVAPDSQTQTCTSFTYTPWSDCVNGQQTREKATKTPTGCTGGGPVLTQSCTMTPATCTSFTYTPWSDCVNGQQTREKATKTPAGCTGGNPLLTQPCTSAPVTCTSFTYTPWSDCVNGQQTREKATKTPTGCTGGGPVLTQSCTVPAANSLRIVTPVSGISIAKKAVTDFKFKILSGFAPSQSMRMWLIKDSGERLDLGTFRLGALIGECIANPNFASFTCDGSSIIKVKLLAGVEVGTYKLKVNNLTKTDESWEVNPIYITPSAANASVSEGNTATVSDTGIWNSIKNLFKR